MDIGAAIPEWINMGLAIASKVVISSLVLY